MQTIVFIGSNKSGTSRDALITSSKMGFHTVLFTDREQFLKQRKEFPEVDQLFYFDDLLEKNKILKKIKRLMKNGCDVRACLSFIDPYVSYTVQLSKELGLMELSYEALNKIEEKTRVREILKEKTYSPFYTTFIWDEPIRSYAKKFEQQLPLILKSPVSNGSKDVLLAQTHDEFTKSLRYLGKKYPSTPVLIEEYLQGPQYLIEVLVYNNFINIVAVIEQEILNSERFIITGYLFPANLTSESYVELEKVVTDIIHELGLTNGNCHLELRNVDGEWKLIEINPRMSGGAMNKIILEGTGINLAERVIKLCLGEEPYLNRSKTEFVYARFITINSRGRLIKVTGKNRASKMEGIKEVYVKPKKGTILTGPYSLGDRYAYVIAAADTAEQAKKYAITAAKEIKFYLDPL
ncbi:ATP-grasp domain-containing protein [Bacillus dakarensis]|uniref:ATP-grasp domain-containing protein n=1 Tax=Robertmurraya dakarensis TaxID=1926278 RepID=UPI00098203F3|nr:ATP-grasp domain-containing protein [Bacillus dakarensis]